MGLFGGGGGIGKILGGAIGGWAGSPLGIGGMALGAGIGSQLGSDLQHGPGTGPPPAPPPPDPRLVEIRERQINQAKDYRANMGNEKAQQTRTAQDDSRRGLASKMAGINTAANKRGLLYSGLKQGDMYGAQREEAGNLAQNTAQINQNVENKAQALDSQAITGAYQGAQNQQQMADINMQRALQERQARSGAMNSLVGAGGMLAGQSLGRA